ncbi:polygalacturonase inhibitor-like [Gastrolobium bilobum]|uniref:polygalacturonase inhibitor-like n=1 Tax=Gastrolobium bilobum TaxID=150636 RepID=UPI002AAFF556|nr:polygalacturonase inhibitor-like [Gastrolobium bilobum]
MTTKLFLFFILLSQATSSFSEMTCKPEDKRILLQIKKELNNPTLLSSWKPHTDCCHSNWYGVVCFPISNIIWSLSLSTNNDLTSQIPPSLGNLTKLETLSFFQLPNLSGPIPNSLSKLTKLKFLTFSKTSISGPIPDFVTKLKNLVTLDLSFNNLSGTLPHSLYKLPNLSGILFMNNKLTGPIPYSYGYFNNTNLPSLFLSNNKLSGTLPLSLARLNSSLIDFSHNRFEGDASMLFGSTKATVLIDLSWNKFAFDMGKLELTKTLDTLDVSHNQIYGNLPMGMENILSLNVSYNRLCGEIPKGGKLQSFDVDTYFHNKCLCGSPLPSCK